MRTQLLLYELENIEAWCILAFCLWILPLYFNFNIWFNEVKLYLISRRLLYYHGALMAMRVTLVHVNCSMNIVSLIQSPIWLWHSRLERKEPSTASNYLGEIVNINYVAWNTLLKMAKRNRFLRKTIKYFHGKYSRRKIHVCFSWKWTEKKTGCTGFLCFFQTKFYDSLRIIIKIKGFKVFGVICWLTTWLKVPVWDFCGRLVVKTLLFHCRGCEFNSWSLN